MASGTTPKLVDKEAERALVGYGAMLTESFVAMMALSEPAVLEPAIYFAMN